MATVHVNDESFGLQVLTASVSGPVLVDFWAPWCAPCRMVAPVLEELSVEYAGKVTIAKVDVDESPVTAQRFGIQSIPTLVLFEDGKPKSAVQGALPKVQLVEFLEHNASTLKPPSIKVVDLKKLLDGRDAVTLLDIRDQGSFSRSHIRGSKRVDPETIEATLASLPKDQRVVLICRTGDDAEELVAMLAPKGYAVLALERGLLEWEGSGHPTYSDKEEQELEA